MRKTVNEIKNDERLLTLILGGKIMVRVFTSKGRTDENEGLASVNGARIYEDVGLASVSEGMTNEDEDLASVTNGRRTVDEGLVSVRRT